MQSGAIYPLGGGSATPTVVVNSKTTDYTVIDSDDGEIIEFNSSSPVNITIPQGLPLGFNCVIVNLGGGTVTVLNSVGVTIRGTATVGSSMFIYQRATNDFVLLSGGGSSSSTAPQLSTPVVSFGGTTVSSIIVNWSQVVGATNYIVKRSTTNSENAATQIYSGTSATFTDTGLSTNTTYYYFISAQATGYTNSASGTGSHATSSVSQLASPTVTFGTITYNSIVVNWTSVTNANNYIVKRNTVNDVATATQIYSGGVLTFSDTGRNPSTTYYYFVIAQGTGFTDSNPGSASQATPAAPLPTLNAPVLTAGTPTATSVPLTWNDANTSPNETNFEIQQSSNGGSTWASATPATAAQNATGITVTGLSASTAYQFRVRAVGDGTLANTSTYSNIVSVTTASAIHPAAQYYINNNTALTQTQKDAWNLCVQGWAADGDLASVQNGLLYLYFGNSQAEQLMNVFANQYNGTIHGTVSLASSTFKPDGSTGYLSTGYNPATVAGAVSQGTSICGIKDGTLATSYSDDYGVSDGTSGWFFEVESKFAPNPAGGWLGNTVSGSGAVTYANNTSPIGDYVMTRTGISDLRLYQNGAVISSNINGTGLNVPNAEMYIGTGNFSGTASQFSPRGQSYTGIFPVGWTDPAVGRIMARLKTFLTALGK